MYICLWANFNQTYYMHIPIAHISFYSGSRSRIWERLDMEEGMATVPKYSPVCIQSKGIVYCPINSSFNQTSYMHIPIVHISFYSGSRSRIWERVDMEEGMATVPKYSPVCIQSKGIVYCPINSSPIKSSSRTNSAQFRFFR